MFSPSNETAGDGFVTISLRRFLFILFFMLTNNYRVVMLSDMVMGNQNKIEISKEIWKVNPNEHPLFSGSKLIRTHNGMGVKRVRIQGLLSMVGSKVGSDAFYREYMCCPPKEGK
jgi:hypothetical protein